LEQSFIAALLTLTSASD